MVSIHFIEKAAVITPPRLRFDISITISIIHIQIVNEIYLILFKSTSIPTALILSATLYFQFPLLSID